MNLLVETENNNTRYLAAALEWLRLLLGRRAEQVGSDTPTPRGCNPFRHGDYPHPHVSNAEIKTAEEAMKAAGASEPPPAFIVLSERLGLSEFERSLLLLCAAMELDTRTAGLCALAQGNPNRPYPTFALALALFDDPCWDAISAERPLRAWRLIEINQPGVQPLTTSALRADERIVHYIKGIDDRLDERLARLVSPLTADEGEWLPPSQARLVESILTALRGVPPHAIVPVVQLLGSDGLSKQLIAQRSASELGMAVFRLNAEWVPGNAGELEHFLRLWQRETILLPIGLFVEARSLAGEGRAPGLQRLLEECGRLVFLDAAERWGELTRPSLLVETARPTADEQEKAWKGQIDTFAPDGPEELTKESPAKLANQFNLSLPTIRQLARTALQGGGEGLAERVWETCLMYSRQRLDVLAQRIEVKAEWDDLVLPPDEKKQLDRIASQVRLRNEVFRRWNFPLRTSRGLGLSVLFAGESGTGKTMAAEVIARRLDLNLYKIDLSAVVSKYIGETEKNLRMLFDAAEYGGVILFFDEADALFGKRSEVKDSHDRYANIEISYLLQRMEMFQGLAILATNMKSALDTAFLRRLRFVVNFPFPGREDRKKIWEKAFPTPPTEEPPHLDYDWLARLNLTGGNIQSIALNAAFLAAQRGEEIGMGLVLEVAKAEFHKLEKPVNEADFQWKKNGAA